MSSKLLQKRSWLAAHCLSDALDDVAVPVPARKLRRATASATLFEDHSSLCGRLGLDHLCSSSPVSFGDAPAVRLPPSPIAAQDGLFW